MILTLTNNQSSIQQYSTKIENMSENVIRTWNRATIRSQTRATGLENAKRDLAEASSIKHRHVDQHSEEL